jgi:hypothetical protein
MNDLNEKAAQNLTAIREKKPLIHNITNFVVMNYTANALLAMGASPVMAHAQNEVEDMVAFAGALVLNIGTLTEGWIHSMIKAGKKASEQQTPIILDMPIPKQKGWIRFIRWKRPPRQQQYWPRSSTPPWQSPGRWIWSPTVTG